MDANHLDRLKARIDRWSDWCRCWSELAAMHEALGRDGPQLATQALSRGSKAAASGA